jgi:chromosome partitioning protein
MQIYALALEKGGVGKTCLAVNLAAAFSRLILRVLVIDLDAQAHAMHWLGLKALSIRPEDSVLGVLNGRALRDCVHTTNEGIDVLPAHAALASLPIQLATAPNSGLFVLQDALAQLSQPLPSYDIIICDLAPARGPVLATALAAATRCIAPVQPEDLVMRAPGAGRISRTGAARESPPARDEHRAQSLCSA